MFIQKIIKGKRLDGFFLKGITSFTFVFLFAYGLYDYLMDAGNPITEPRIVLLVSIGLGLVLGLIGDLFLEVQYFYPKQKTRQIRYGMVAFGFTHLFYLVGMSEFVGFNYFSLLVGAVMTVVVYFGSKAMNIDFGKLKLMTLAYTFIIFTMVGMTVFQAVELSFNAYSTSFMIGAILFGISDLLLAPIYFQNVKGNVFPISNLATYYAGQVLIALAVYLL
jgi:uncharacterized membrane protein YhhN